MPKIVLSPTMYARLIAEDPKWANFYEPWGQTPEEGGEEEDDDDTE